MKICFEMKEMLDFNFSSNNQPIPICFGNIIRKIKKNYGTVMMGSYEIINFCPIANPTNTPRVFHVETTWKRPFSCRFNVEYK